MTLLEIIFALPVVLIAASMLASTLVAIAKQRSVTLENAVVSTAVQEVFERMRNEDLRDLFRLYNAEPFDDPFGPGTAPGNFFGVEGLTSLPNIPPGSIGEIFLPAVNTGTGVAPVWELREDMQDPDCQMPRDLNGDSVIDDQDHGADYVVMPVHVRVRWQGKFGPREFNMHTLLSEFE